MLEAVRQYDVDGVHFDDFFYPIRRPARTSRTTPATPVCPRRQSRADWRRENVNTLVREMDTRIKQLKPWVKFGISPFGIWRNARTDRGGSDTSGLESHDAIYADTRTWVREGWLDYIVPQLYWAIGFDRADYARCCPGGRSWSRAPRCSSTSARATTGWGEGPWSDPGQIERQLALNDRTRSAQRALQRQADPADRLGAVSATATPTTRRRRCCHDGPAARRAASAPRLTRRRWRPAR